MEYKEINDIDKVYFVSDLKNIKIGYTKKPIEKRIKELSTGSPHKLYCLGYIYGDMQTEQFLHIKFGQYRIRSDGEWFYPVQELIDYINENNKMPNTWIEKDENGKIQKYFSMKIVK